MKVRQNQWRAISLFSGAGGCSLGFRDAGVKILAAFDNSESAIDTYNLNFGANMCRNVDLATCDFYKLRDSLNLVRGELDLIIGGPPCQGFTTAGNRFWDDPRNKLVQNYAHALEAFYPRWFMMENVEGILTTAKGSYIIECIKKMISLGYAVSLKKFYMQEYGIPQRRKRVIIVGNREGKQFSFPKPIEIASGSIYKESSFTLRSAIGDLENHSRPEIDHIIKEETGIQLERISALLVGQTMRDLPERLQHDSFKRRSARRVCDGTPTEKRGGAPSGLKRLSYDEPCLTITSAAPSEFVHPTQNRMLTIRECARVQTFPDSFTFCGTDSQKILQIGNAIPPLFASQMAEHIMLCDLNAPGEVVPSLVSFDVTKATAQSPALQKTCAKLISLQMQEFEQLRLGDMTMAVTKQQKAFYKQFAQHGSGNAMVEIEPKDVILLVHIAYLDIFECEPEWFLPSFAEIAKSDFYKITPEQVEALPDKSLEEAVNCLQLCGATNPDNIIYLYLKNLSELWRRRFKFYNILRNQPFPLTEQIAPRCLLEYGHCEDDLLFSWMCWRKLIYDIDNRSAQETGYLFEPILASCLGGEAISHRHSPVKRINDNGVATSEGRQIDCYIEETKEAYELKLRVTIAASGQGRFNEEMSFPYEAKKAGITPILIVFDPTPSPLLDRLKAKYVEEGGRYAIGEDAWNMLTERAGTEMGKYIIKYIKPPISRMDQIHTAIPADLHISAADNKLVIRDDNGNSYTIPRDEAAE